MEWGAVAMSDHSRACGTVFLTKVQPGEVNGGWLGDGGGLSRAGIPTIGYIPQPNYLCAGPENCEIEKLSGELMHSQIGVFAKVLHGVNRLSAAQLKAV